MTGCSICGVKHDRLRANGKPQSYCLSCHASWMRKHRPKHTQLSDEARRKANARAVANVYQRRGKLKRKPCASCGAKRAQKHHPDYSKPLRVVWLCRGCHLDHHHHREQRIAA